MHAKIYQKILDGNVEFFLKYMIQMGAGNADIVSNIRHTDSLHICLANIIYCKVYINIVTIAGLLLRGIEIGRGMMFGKDGKQFEEYRFAVKVIGKACIAMRK